MLVRIGAKLSIIFKQSKFHTRQKKNKCSVPVDWLLGAEGVEFSGELVSLCEMIK